MGREPYPLRFLPTSDVEDDGVDAQVREEKPSGKWGTLTALGKPGLMMLMLPMLLMLVVMIVVMVKHWPAIDSATFGLMQLVMMLAYAVVILAFLAVCIIGGTLVFRFVSRKPMRVVRHQPNAPVAVVEIGGRTVEPTNFHPQPLSQVRSLSISNTRQAPDRLEETEEPLALPSPRLPTSQELIEQGRIGHGDILLGFNAQGAEIRRTRKEFVSYLVAGVQGGGKTSTAAWLAAQIGLARGKIAVVDWDATAEESLSQKLRPFESAFAVLVGDTPEKTLHVIAYARRLLERRIAGLEPADYHFVLFVDEFTDMMRHRGRPTQAGQAADELADLLEFLNSRGRKRLVSVVCIGQATNASRSGGSEVRDLFNERLAHAMQEKQAQLLGLTAYKTAIARLGKGEVYADLRGYPEPFLLYVPFLTDEAIRMVAERLPPVSVMTYDDYMRQYGSMAGNNDPTNLYPQMQPTQPTSDGYKPLIYKPGQAPIAVTGTGPQIAALLMQQEAPPAPPPVPLRFVGLRPDEAATRFLDECVEFGGDLEVETRALYAAYHDWCRRERVAELAAQKFAPLLKERGCWPTRHAGGENYWGGLALKSAPVAAAEPA